MKKYVALIVCAILALTALFLPIGHDARSDGEGNGTNQKVNSIKELTEVLGGKSATYTFKYREGLTVSRYSFDIPLYGSDEANQQTDIVNVYQDETCFHRVTDLNAGNTAQKGYGAFVDDINYGYFIGYNMDNGLVKVAYQNDGGSLSYGYSSASELGMLVKEAQAKIPVYSDSAYTDKVMTIAKNQVFILDSAEDTTKIKYSDGESFQIGYIKSNASFKDVKIMVSFNNKIDLDTTGVENTKNANKIAAFKTAYQLKLPQGNMDQATWMDRLTPTYLNQGTVYRYYGAKRAVAGDAVIDSAQIRYKGADGWVTAYIDLSAAHIVEASYFERMHTDNLDEGTIKLYVTDEGTVYAQIKSEITLMTEPTAKRYAIDAEMYLSDKGSLVKFNNLYYEDEGGSTGIFKETYEKNANFVAGIELAKWMSLQEAKLVADVASGDNYISPFRIFIDKYFTENGGLQWTKFLSMLDSSVLAQDGSEYTLKDSYQQAFCETYYVQAIGLGYEHLLPDLNTERASSIDIDLSDAKRPVIKTNFKVKLLGADIYKHNSSTFESGSDRTLVIENIGNTIVPKIVAEEVNQLLKG